MITPPVTVPSISTSQQLASATDLQELSRGDIGQAFKNMALRSYIERLIAKNEQRGVTTDVSIIDLRTNQAVVNHNLDTEQFAASVNKLPVADLVLRDLRTGTLQFDQVLSWSASDVRAGAGAYDQPGAPQQATVKDLLFDLLNPSGNTAVRVLVNQGLGGAATVNTRFTNELHLSHTYLQPLDTNRFYLGNTTAREALSSMRDVLSTNDTYGAFVKNALATNIYTDYGVRSQLAGNDYIVLANKVGILDDTDGNNRHDVGVIYNTKTHQAYGYAFLNTAHGDATNTATAQAGASLADMGEAVLRAAGDKASKQQPLSQQLKQHRGERRIEY